MLKIVVFVPVAYAEKVRTALGNAGAGEIGKYKYCSYSTRGHGRYIAQPAASPHVGAVGHLEIVDEERIETFCAPDRLDKVVGALKEIHPYESFAIDVYEVNWRVVR